jgi:hypothetical protein
MADHPLADFGLFIRQESFKSYLSTVNYCTDMSCAKPFSSFNITFETCSAYYIQENSTIYMRNLEVTATLYTHTAYIFCSSTVILIAYLTF